MSENRVSDEIVEKAFIAWEGVLLPDEMPIAQQEREGLRAALEAALEALAEPDEHGDRLVLCKLKAPRERRPLTFPIEEIDGDDQS